MMFLGNMLVFITSLKNMVVEFAGGHSVATRSYMIIHSVAKIYCFASVFTRVNLPVPVFCHGITITRDT